jgi:LppX_LprAFG lipoprotein
VAVVIVAVAVVILAQGSGSGGSPLNAIAKAAEVTQREPGGHAEIEARVTTSTGEGITESGSMTFDDSGKAEGTLTAQGQSTGKEVEITSISSGTTAYMTSDAFGSLPGGKKWMEIDFSNAVKGQGSPAPTQGSSPQEGLKILEHVDGVKKLGKEDVNGVPTTHYTGTFPASEEVFGAKVDSSAPRVDAWIDAQGRVRRTKIAVTTSVKESEGPTHTEMTIDYTDFGRVPKIELPPADEVFDITGEIESKVQAEAEGN